jgi:hypothetical protein
MWVARSHSYDFFIHYTSPVLTGAQGGMEKRGPTMGPALALKLALRAVVSAISPGVKCFTDVTRCSVPMHKSQLFRGKAQPMPARSVAQVSVFLWRGDGYNADRSSITVERQPKDPSRPQRSPSQNHEDPSADDRAAAKPSVGAVTRLDGRGVGAFLEPPFHIDDRATRPSSRGGHGSKK